MRKPSIYMSEQIKDDLLPKYLCTLKTEATRERYQNVICLYCDYMQQDFLDSTEADIMSYFEYLKNRVREKTMTQKTMLANISCLKCFGDYVQLHTHGEFVNYFAKIIRPVIDTDNVMEHVPSLRELDMLLDVASEDHMYYTILSLVIKCALSASQVLSLTKKRIVMREGRVALFFPTKSIYKEDLYVPLPEDVADILLSYVENHLPFCDEWGHLFYNKWQRPLTMRNLDVAIAKLYQKCGTGRTYTMQELRNASILYMLSNGAKPCDVADYTGLTQLRISQFLAMSDAFRDYTNPADLMHFSIKPIPAQQE